MISPTLEQCREQALQSFKNGLGAVEAELQGIPLRVIELEAAKAEILKCIAELEKDAELAPPPADKEDPAP